METYFNIRYEFDIRQIHSQIDARLLQPGSDYICVADGNILVRVHQSKDYGKIVNAGLFSICDGHWTTIYLKWIYGIKRDSYCGSDIFLNLLNMRKYSMAFIGGSIKAQEGLKEYMKSFVQDSQICFLDLPFNAVDRFDYKTIGEDLNKGGYDIIWVGLGAPKQEEFMHYLKPYLKHGVMIGVGAVFNFYGGTSIKRAPQWMRKNHLEFIYRIYSEPRKQLSRCINIIKILPRLLYSEWRNKCS